MRGEGIREDIDQMQARYGPLDGHRSDVGRGVRLSGEIWGTGTPLLGGMIWYHQTCK